MSEIQTSTSNKVLLLIPSFGIGLFLVMYIAAAVLYPGGSRFDPQAKGFSLLHNYWCDLFYIVAPNGSVNPARPVAVAAIVLLAASFSGWWYAAPGLFNASAKVRRIIRLTGIGSMVAVTFLFTEFHEEAIHLGGLLGGIALMLTLAELYKAGEQRLFWMGLTCLALSGLNYLIYQTRVFWEALAILQKATFLAFFAWAVVLNFRVYRKNPRGGEEG